MIQSIGETAGQVWKLLNECGPASLSSIKSCLKIKQNLILQAIGWLAREDKIRIEEKGRTVIYSAKG